jgi:hypothetical protein
MSHTFGSTPLALAATLLALGCPRASLPDSGVLTADAGMVVFDAGPRPLQCGVARCIDGAGGVESCDDGDSRNRAVAVACPVLLAPPEPGRGTRCHTHAECDAGTYCVVVDGYVLGGEGEEETACEAPCTTDDDCDGDHACLCAHHGDFNTCIDAECRTPDDCGGAPCGISRPGLCSPALLLACRLDEDGCAQSECGECVSSGGGVWGPRATGDCD